MRFRPLKHKSPEVDIAPLIDCIFLLLIFFLLSSSFVMQPGIRIKLPQAATAEAHPQRDILILIDEKERIFLNDRYLKEKEELGQILRELIDQGRSKTLIIKADEVVHHGLVVEVMDVARQAGIEKLAIATQPKKVIKR